MGISGFPASVGVFDKTKYDNQYNVDVTLTGNYTSYTALDVSGVQGFIDTMELYNEAINAGGNPEIKITVDGKVLWWGKINQTITTTFIQIYVGDLTGGVSDATPAPFLVFSNTIEVLSIVANPFINVKDGSVISADTSERMFIKNKIVWNDSILVEFFRGTTASSALRVKVDYFTK